MRMDVDYCRISADKSGSGDGVDSQHEENVEFAGEVRLKIGESYVDNDTSAFRGERAEYERLCADIAGGRVASVTFWHANRLHRDVEEASRFLRLAREYKVRLFSVSKGGEYHLGRTAGRQEFLSDTLKAQGESEERGDRVRLARQRQARTGAYGGGVRCFGWGVETGRVRSVCVNPKAPPMERVYEDRPVLDMTRHNQREAAEIQRWARDLLDGVSMAQVLRDLASREVPTVAMTDDRTLRRGGKTVGHEGWNSRTVRQILTNPRTSGHTVHQGRIVQRNAYEPILSEDTRQALITLFSDPARRTSPGNTPKWLGSLIFRCGVCDDDTTMSVRRNCRATPVYRCRARGHCQVPAERVDAYVERVIIDRLCRDDLVELIPENNPDVDVASLRDELVLLDQRKIEAAQRFAAGSIDGAMMDTITATVDHRIGEVRAQLAEATTQSPLTEFATAVDVRQHWESLTIGRKREILRLMPFSVTLLPIGRGGVFDHSRVHFATEPQAA